MTDNLVSIDAAALKSVRKARKLGRPRLAREVGVTERQIARLEGGGAAGNGVAPDLVVKLSAVLEISSDVLIGEQELHDLDLAPRSKKSCSCCG